MLGGPCFLRTLMAFAAAAMFPGALAAQSGAAPATASRPNIVYILADDLGYGDVSCFYPAGKIPTPNIDKLASQGMKFTDAHSASSLCSPTRYSIITGR